MKYVISFTLSFFLINSVVFGQTDLDIKIEKLGKSFLELERDSLKQSLEDISIDMKAMDEQDSLWIKYFYTCTQICQNRDLWQVGLGICNEVINKEVIQRDSYYFPKVLSAKQKYFSNLEISDSTDFYTNATLKAAKVNGQLDILGEIHLTKAINYQANDSQILAIREFILADSIFELGTNRTSQGLVNFNLANSYYLSDDFESALFYFRKAAELHSLDNINYPYDLQAVAIVLIEMDSLAQAENILIEVDSFMKEVPNGRRQNAVALQSVQYRQGKYKKSLKTYKNIVSQNENADQRNVDGSTELAILSYLELDETQNARKLYENNKNLLSKSDEGAQLYLGISIDLQKAYGIPARKRFAEYIDLKDSIHMKAINNKALEINEKYQTEKVNSENQFLKEESQLKEKNLKLQRNGLIALIIGALGILLLLLRLIRQNTKITAINNDLDIKNTQIKLFSRETIHRTKNQIALIANLITNQKQLIGKLSAEELMEDIDGKVRALAEVNRSLDNNEEESSVEISPIFQSILENNTYSLSKKEIVCHIEGEGIKVDGNKVSNLALVINELNTNSIKYAFAEVDDPTISINAAYQEDDLMIVYKDNGKTVDNQVSKKGKGSELIEGIVQYMGGSITNTITNQGYTSTIKLPRHEK